MTKQPNFKQLSFIAAAVAAAFALPSQAAVTVAGAGASAINAAVALAVVKDYCAAGSAVGYDSGSGSSFPKGNTWSISCTPASGSGITTNPLVVSYDVSGGSWKAFTSFSPALLALAQADQLANGGQNAPQQVDPATTTCGTTNETNVPIGSSTTNIPTVHINCSFANSRPTFGFTDVEPNLFTGSTTNQPLQWGTWNTGGVNLQSPFTPGTPGTEAKAFGVVFGIAASGALWGAMQSDELAAGILPTAVCGTTYVAGAASNALEVCTPIISKELYASLIDSAGSLAQNDAQALFVSPPAAAQVPGGNYAGTYDYPSTTTTLAAKAPQFVGMPIPALEIARRDQGSGTQGSSNATFMDQGCTVTSTEIASVPATPDLSNVQGGAYGSGNNYINNSITWNVSTGDVLNRLQGVLSSDGFEVSPFPTNNYVIGVVSGEKYSASSINGAGAFGTSTAPYGFLRYEGALPTTARLSQGLYSYTTTEWFYCQAGLVGDQAKLCSDLTSSTFADSLEKYAESGIATGIYPIASAATGGGTDTYAQNGTYHTNGATCTGARHR